MMVCMAGLQVFIVRFFFQVCFPCGEIRSVAIRGADQYLLGREKGIRVNDWMIARHCMLRLWWDIGKIWDWGSRNSVYFYIVALMSEGIDP